MTLAQFIEVIRRRHNAESDSYWSDAELYQLVTNRCNEVLSYIGLLEGVETSTSTSGTQVLAYPDDCVTIRQITYKADALKRITFRDWESYKTETTTQSGRPYMWVPWNRQAYLVPIPDTTGDTITAYYYKEHPYIENSSVTSIQVPSVLHAHLVNGVVADMFAKDENNQMATFYETKWNQVSIPAFLRFKAMEDQGGGFSVTGDADSGVALDVGVI